MKLKVKSTNKESVPTPVKVDGLSKHTVATGETLYKISVMYKVSVDQLKQWNGLKDNAIAVGQSLIVKQP
jgi:LysM repeat protein